jgi:hypothetical protein
MLKMACRIGLPVGLPEHVDDGIQNRTARTGVPEQDYQYGTTSIGPPGQDSNAGLSG